MADGRYPDIYPDDPRACAGCGRLPAQVEAASIRGGPVRRSLRRACSHGPRTPALRPGKAGPSLGPASGPVLCVDCVDRARASRASVRGTCAICGRDVGRTQPGARVGEQDDGPVICRACLDGLAAAMVEPD